MKPELRRRTGLVHYSDTPMTHQGGLADLEATATAADPKQIKSSLRKLWIDFGSSFTLDSNYATQMYLVTGSDPFAIDLGYKFFPTG